MSGSTTFAFFDTNEPLVLFFIDYVAVMVLFALLGALTVYLLGKLSKKLPLNAAHAKND